MKKASKIITIITAIVCTVLSTIMFASCTEENSTPSASGEKKITVQYVADGTAARTLLLNSESGIDFAVVGEPAATTFMGVPALNLNAKMNMQSEYQLVSGQTTYPQAGLFVKNEVANNREFMTALYAALSASKTWAFDNSASVNAFAKENLYESASFPQASIANCAINAQPLTDESKNQIITFLKSVAGTDAKGNAIDWDAQNTKLFTAGDTLADSKTSYRFTAPEGTPALAILRLPVDNTSIAGKNMEYEIVSPSNIAAEMSAGKSDLVIMPVNAGANLIRQGANYTLVSVAVDGSLYMIGRTANGGTITMDDINGKKIACIGKTGVPGLIFRYVMQQNGFTIEE